jgi:hypothetical protein
MKRININLAAYPDSDTDSKWDTILGPTIVEMMRHHNEPVREVLPCECGHLNTLFVARDHKRPELVFSGVICPNPECGILTISIATDEDGVRE